MFTLLLASAVALTGLASAQNGTQGAGTYSTSGPLYVDPNSVDFDLRQSWCRGQQNNCPFICAGPDANIGDAYPNNCDPQDLTYTCTCTNGNQPNISAYIDTLPYYICDRWRGDCTAAHPNDLTGQTACQSVQCGTKNATAGANSTTASSGGSSASATASSSPSASGGSGGSGGSGSSSGDTSASASASQASSSGNAAASVGMEYGTGILMGGMLAVFGLAL